MWHRLVARLKFVWTMVVMAWRGRGGRPIAVASGTVKVGFWLCDDGRVFQRKRDGSQGDRITDTAIVSIVYEQHAKLLERREKKARRKKGVDPIEGESVR